METGKLATGNGKGFHNCFHNYGHDGEVFTESEQLYMDIIAKEFPELPVLHETLMKFNEDGNKSHYWVDFFFPTLRIVVEINPAWHEHYEPVVARDKVKARLLATRQNILSIPVRIKGKIVNGRWQPRLNQEDTRKSLKILKEAQISPECLNYYL